MEKKKNKSSALNGIGTFIAFSIMLVVAIIVAVFIVIGFFELLRIWIT